jgi:hypothetical protein
VKFALAALAIGVLAALLMPPLAFKEAFEGMLTFLGLVFASVVPAMALTVSTLRASRRSIREVRSLRRALEVQLRFWMSFLGVTGAAAALLITASVLGWPAQTLIGVSPFGVQLNISGMTLLNSLIMFLTVLVIAKSPSFARGMRDLLHLHLDQVEAESLSALQQEHGVVAEAILEKRREDDPDFGRLIDDRG